MSLIDDVKRQMELGIAQPSITRTALGKQADFGLNDTETAFAVSAPFAAGVGTVIIPFISGFLSVEISVIFRLWQRWMYSFVSSSLFFVFRFPS
jgi:hypothetical protein